jgi:hypothetical protein
MSFSALNELNKGGLLVVNDKNNLILNERLIALVYYKLDLLEEFDSNYSEVYSLIESSSAIKCPNVFSVLANISPIKEQLLKSENVNKMFSEQELANEVLRFFPKTLVAESQDTEQFTAEVEYIKEKKSQWKAINYKKTLQKTNSEENIDQVLEELSNKKDAKDIVLHEVASIPQTQAIILSDENLKQVSVSSKLHIYGVTLLSSSGQVIRNKTIGISVRSRSNGSTTDILTTPLLIPEIRTRDDELTYE